MKMNFGGNVEIQDLGNHPAATVVGLGILLAGTVDATPDPKRKGFYEIRAGATVYYISESARAGIIFLLATWRIAMPPAAEIELIPQHSRGMNRPGARRTGAECISVEFALNAR